jgi:hypothetical protein
VVLPSASTANASDEKGESLIGSWLERVTPSTFPSFDVLITFNVGGVLTASSSGDLTPGTLSGPVHGVWRPAGARSFSWFGLAFAFDAQGQAQGMDHIQKTITLAGDGQTYTGTGSFKRVLKGQVLFSGDETVTGSRVAE